MESLDKNLLIYTHKARERGKGEAGKMKKNQGYSTFLRKKIENFHHRSIIYTLLERQYLELSESLFLFKIG